MAEMSIDARRVQSQYGARFPAVAIILAALTAAVLFISAWNYGPFGDEFYYIDCGRHLDAGYVDHPPLVALTSHAVRTLFGTSYIALLPLGAPVLPVERLISYGKATGLVDDLKIHRHDRVDLPVHFALRFGWREMVESVSQAYKSLPEEEQEGAVIVTNDYAKAGAVNYYRREFDLPEAISGHNSYRYWLPEDMQVSAVIAVGLDEEQLRRIFRDIDLFKVHHHPHATQWETGQEIFIAREPRNSWSQIRSEMHWY
jgi:hypothetical protein